MKTISVVIEERNGGFFYIGITDGERDDFFIYTDSLAAALEAAEYLKNNIEGTIH